LLENRKSPSTLIRSIEEAVAVIRAGQNGDRVDDEDEKTKAT